MATGLLTLYKTLNPDRTPCLGGRGAWPPEGEWLRVDGPLRPRKNGLHVCWVRQLVYWLGPTIWEVEVDGERIDQWDKIVVREARLTHRVERWTEPVARLFAADCAERALPIWERDFPHDAAPRQAVLTARRYAAGHATAAELYEAGKLAALAQHRASWAAVKDAAEAAVWATAMPAGTAARNAARYAALASGPEQRRDQERRWQTGRLINYLTDTETDIATTLPFHP